jgi:hypothetical protein
VDGGTETVRAVLTMTVTADEITGVPELSFTWSSNDQIPVIDRVPLSDLVPPAWQINEGPKSLKASAPGAFSSGWHV